jgi:hypothetical protein
MTERHHVLTQPQYDAYQLIKPSTTTVLPWSRGNGKSWFQRFIAYDLISRYDGVRINGRRRKGVRIVWLMDTLKHFRDVHGALMREELSDNGRHGWGFLGGSVNKSTLRVEFPGGSWMQPFPALEHTGKSALGLRCDVVLADEVDDIPSRTFHTVAKPWMTEPWSLDLWLCGGTPRHGRHGLLYELYKLGLSDAAEHARYRQVFADWGAAPEIVSRAAVDDARANTPPAIFAREWECKFDHSEGLVYDIFDEDFHIRKPPENIGWSEVIVGVDWGYSDPGVFLVFGIQGQGEDAVAWLIEEHYHRELTIDQWASIAHDIHRRYPAARWWADPSRPDSIRTIQRAGPVVKPADNAIADGVQRVATMMMVHGQPPEPGETDNRWSRFYVHPWCRHTLEELRKYKRKPDRGDPDLYTDEFIDAYNHAMDATRYALFSRFGGPSATRHEWSGQQFG